MNKYAILNAANIITNVIEGDGDIAELEAHYSQHFGTTVKHIPPATPAGKGWFWHDTAQAFIQPQPYPSYTLDETTWTWQPPVPKPTNHNEFYWDEQKQDWVDTIKQELDRVFDQARENGYAFTHNSETYHLQCREKDAPNWLIVRGRAERMQPTDIYSEGIMTLEDVPIFITASEVVALMDAVESHGVALYRARWAIKTQISTGAITDTTQVETAFDQALQTLLAG